MDEWFQIIGINHKEGVLKVKFTILLQFYCLINYSSQIIRNFPQEKILKMLSTHRLAESDWKLKPN